MAESPGWRSRIWRPVRNAALATAMLAPSCSDGIKPFPVDSGKEFHTAMDKAPPDCKAALESFYHSLDNAVDRLVQFEKEEINLGNLFNPPKRVQIAFQPPENAEEAGIFKIYIRHKKNTREKQFPEIIELYRKWEALQAAENEAHVPPAGRFNHEQVNRLALSMYCEKTKTREEHKVRTARRLLSLFVTKPLMALEEMRLPQHISADEQAAIDENFTKVFKKLLAHLEEHNILNKELDKNWHRHIGIERLCAGDANNKLLVGGTTTIRTLHGFHSSVQQPSPACVKQLRNEMHKDALKFMVLDGIYRNTGPSSFRGAAATAFETELYTPLGEIPVRLTAYAHDTTIVWPPVEPRSR